jgi:hypothetical protein
MRSKAEGLLPWARAAFGSVLCQGVCIPIARPTKIPERKRKQRNRSFRNARNGAPDASDGALQFASRQFASARTGILFMKRSHQDFITLL